MYVLKEYLYEVPDATNASGIYALVNSKTFELYYIGRATDPNERFINHIQGNSWIKKLLKEGQGVSCFMIELCSQDQLDDREFFWFDYFYRDGAHLFNRLFKHNLKYLNQVASLFGGECIDLGHIDGYRKATFQCAKGHPQFKKDPTLFVNEGHWCNQCTKEEMRTRLVSAGQIRKERKELIASNIYTGNTLWANWR